MKVLNRFMESENDRECPQMAVPTRFRHNAFGWKSDTPIQRIKEALTEIKQVARKEPVLAAEGAVRLLEKCPPRWHRLTVLPAHWVRR